MPTPTGLEELTDQFRHEAQNRIAKTLTDLAGEYGLTVTVTSNGHTKPPKPARSTKPASRAAKPTNGTGKRGRPPGQGKTADKIVAVLLDHPEGVKIVDIGKILHTPPNYFYRALPKLVAQGRAVGPVKIEHDQLWFHPDHASHDATAPPAPEGSDTLS
jgi:hypothetical protein